MSPSSTPSNFPSNAPSIQPSSAPTFVPTSAPSFSPTLLPSNTPTLAPTRSPSNTPTFTSSMQPTLLHAQMDDGTSVAFYVILAIFGILLFIFLVYYAFRRKGLYNKRKSKATTYDIDGELSENERNEPQNIGTEICELSGIQTNEGNNNQNKRQIVIRSKTTEHGQITFEIYHDLIGRLARCNLFKLSCINQTVYFF
eukprot:319204_1